LKVEIKFKHYIFLIAGVIWMTRSSWNHEVYKHEWWSIAIQLTGSICMGILGTNVIEEIIKGKR